jgi:hypothetical protein
MKKLLFLVLMVIITNSLIAQSEQTELAGALGLTFGMNATSVKDIMGKKGSTLREATPEIITYENVQIGTKKADLLSFHIVNDKLHTIKALFISEIEAKTQDIYDDLKNILGSKYGEPKSYRDFTDPYKDGDGYEMQAVRLGKAAIESYWSFKNDKVIALEIRALKTEMYVSLVYQDSKLFEEVKAKQGIKNKADF